MQQITRILSMLLLFLIPAMAIDMGADWSAQFMGDELAKRQACTTLPCSGNATCENYACGYCMADYCQYTEAELKAEASGKAAYESAASAKAAMATAMPKNDAGRFGVTGGLVAAAAGVAAAGLL